jgi:hypothetical protein
VLNTEEWRVMVRESVAQIGIAYYATQEMIHTLGYQKVCWHWVSLLLVDEHKMGCMMCDCSCFNEMLLKALTSYKTLWLVMKAGSTIITTKQSTR